MLLLFFRGGGAAAAAATGEIEHVGRAKGVRQPGIATVTKRRMVGSLRGLRFG